MALKTKKRFSDLCRPLNKDEFRELEAAIVADGRVLDPIIVMRGDVILDGHNRYKIATKHKLPYDIIIKDFPSEDEAELWAIRHQLARRNLSAHDYRIFVGRLYNAEKKAHGGTRKSSPNSEDLKKTSEKVAEETGVSHGTVERAGKRAASFDKLPTAVQTLISDQPTRATDKAISKMATMPASDLTQLARQVRTGQKPTFDKALGLGNGKPKRKKASREKVTAAQLFDAMQRQHFSGASGLPQSLDKLAETIGSRGENYKAANGGLNVFLKHGKEMRKGKP